MKALAEMTIDEAIELACREVPECASKVTLTLKLTKPCSCPSIPTVDTTGLHEACRALWFDAAYDWLAGQPGCVTDDGDTYLPAKLNGQWFDGQYPKCLLPTKYHALAAACLLAAGKEVP